MAIAVACASAGLNSSSATIVDRVVVVVERELVLESDVRLESVLSPLDGEALPFWHQREPDALTRLVDAAIIRHLAADVQLYQPSPSDVVNRVEAIRAHFPDRGAWTAFLNQWGLNEEALRVIIRRRLVVERYLTRNITSDPSRHTVWTREITGLLQSVRPRLRIRSIELKGTGGLIP